MAARRQHDLLSKECATLNHRRMLAYTNSYSIYRTAVYGVVPLVTCILYTRLLVHDTGTMTGIVRAAVRLMLAL